MKKTAIYILFSLLLIASTAVGFSASGTRTIRVKVSKNIVTKSFDVKEFDAINLSIPYTVVYTKGEPSATVECPDNLLEYIECRVSRGTLNIAYVNARLNLDGNAKILFTISSPELKDVTVSGSGRVIVDTIASQSGVIFGISGSGRILCSSLAAETLTASVSGSGRIVCDKMDSHGLIATISGSGVITLNGEICGEECIDYCEVATKSSTRNIIVGVSGSGKVAINNITTSGDVRFDLGGSGSITSGNIVASRVHVKVSGSGVVHSTGIDSQTVEASVVGSGTINLDGEVCSARYTISGSGRILAKELASQEVVANVSGSGRVECYAISDLKAGVSGSGTILYKGSPKTMGVLNKQIQSID